MNERIRDLRNALNLTQQEIADKLGTSRGNIAGYETGRRSPSDAVVSLICREFNVNEEWLRTGEGDMFKKRLPVDEVSNYVEDLLEYSGNGNPFYDMIIEMMRTYHELDGKSQSVIRGYFGAIKESMNKKKED